MCSIEKRGNIFILTLTSNKENDEHRINPTLITSIRSAVSAIKSEALASPDSSFTLITTSTGKFFSNGFDLNWAKSQSNGNYSNYLKNINHCFDCFKPLMSDFMSLPMPTIAAINGHAVAPGFALALCHDYLLMKKDRGVLYMNEVENGFTFPEYFNVFAKDKLGWKPRRELMLRGKRLKGEEGLELGVVDQVFGSAEELFEGALCLSKDLVSRKWNGKVYAEIRKGLCPNLCKEFGLATNSFMIPKM
ncbi:Enoyl-CoA delta isomerase 3 [Bienertia sinuspersici]